VGVSGQSEERNIPKKDKVSSFTFRELESMSLERIEKKDPRPDPGTYNPKIKHRILGSGEIKSNRSGFIENSEWVGMQTPGHVYSGVDLDKVKERARVAKILT